MHCMVAVAGGINATLAAAAMTLALTAVAAAKTDGGVARLGIATNSPPR